MLSTVKTESLKGERKKSETCSSLYRGSTKVAVHTVQRLISISTNNNLIRKETWPSAKGREREREGKRVQTHKVQLTSVDHRKECRQEGQRAANRRRRENLWRRSVSSLSETRRKNKNKKRCLIKHATTIFSQV
jgi:hypothetical protein